ncbi:MAG: hypothetical protein ORN28_07805 [Rhodoferax sp.]|nr:hypothetical protein [Rhodoferax sp.]
MGFDNAIVIDSDVLFLNDFSPSVMFKALSENYSKKAFYATKSSDPFLTKIIDKSSGFIGVNFKNEWGGYLYGWFFDIPYYERQDFNDMVAHLNTLYADGWYEHLDWFTFDHLIYQYYLTFKKGWQMMDYSGLSALPPEWLTPSELLAICEHQNYFPAWISLKSFFAMPGIKAINGNMQILYHTDR